MATPLGVKTFVAGDVLLATEINGFLMAQVIAVFADAAARDAAILDPEEGQFAYIIADGALTLYNGTVWLPFASGGGLEPASPLLLMGA